MSIAKRITLLIVAAVIGLLALGGVSLFQMGRINANLEYANNRSIPALRKIEAIDSAFLRVRIMFISLNFVVPESQKPELTKGFNKSKDDLNQLLSEYKALALNDEDRAYLETTWRIVGEYLAILDSATSLIQEKNMEAAKAQSAVAREITARLAKNIAEHSHYHTKLAADEAARGASAYRQGAVENVVIAVLAALAIGTMGFMMQHHVTGSLNEMNDAFDRVAKTLDFTGRLPAKGDDELGRTAASFNRLLDRLQQSLREILSKTEAVNSAAERVATASNQMSANSGQQSEAASSMAATMEEMTVSINHVADRAGDAESLSRTSQQRAQQGTTIIEGAVTEINGIALAVDAASGHITRLEQNSERINSVLSVIKEVADQTNLLALNAAIEAARAGEQGRGFAVVADEVRKLAERTTQSTHEISVTISEMQTGARQAVEGVATVVTKTESGVAQAEKANQAIREIGESSKNAVGMVDEISQAIREQSSASTNIAQQVERIAQMAEENNSASQSTSATASELALLVRDMRSVVGQYKV